MAHKEVAPTSSPRMSAEDKRWRAEDAIRTLTRADEIKRDAGLMREVKRMAGQQAKTLQKVAGGAAPRPAARGKK